MPIASIERLTAEDTMMLWPDEIWPQDIGALAILDGRRLLDADGRLRLTALRDFVASRLHLVPQFRQRLYVPPKRLGGPLWVDDDAFDVANHVRAISLPPPGDEPELLAAMERLRRQRLERARPLWQIWFITGMPSKRVGMFVRMHHSIGDGIAGVATIGTFLDMAPDGVGPSPERWAPASVPTAAQLRREHREERVDQLESTLSGLTHPLRIIRQALAAWPGLREILADRALPPTSLDRRVGANRRVALIRGKLDLVREIAHRYDAKVNDVLLCLIGGAIRRLLQSRGEAVDGTVVRVYVPVSLRHHHYEGARGNLIAQMVVPLSIGTSDPVDRLRQIVAETSRRKMRPRPSVGKLPHGRVLGPLFLRLVDRQRVNVTTADLPGPPVLLYFAGAPVVEVFPLLPLIGKVSLGVGALSYAGQFNVTAIGDGDGYPDLEVFAAGFRDELQALAASIGAR